MPLERINQFGFDRGDLSLYDILNNVISVYRNKIYSGLCHKIKCLILLGFFGSIYVWVLKRMQNGIEKAIKEGLLKDNELC